MESERESESESESEREEERTIEGGVGKAGERWNLA